MSYCPSCGAELTAGARFCANCGTAVSSTAITSSTYTTVTTGDYSLVLMGLGTCPQLQADDIIQDLLGYSELDCIEILTSMPTEIARGLTQQQALYLAQAFTEYGMEIAVYCGGTYVDLSGQATTSVYQSDGSIVKNVLATLATVTIANRLSQFLRWTKPAPPAPFRPRYYTPKPPVHVRRSIVRAPEPRHQPRPAHPSPAAHHNASGPHHAGGPSHRGSSIPSIPRQNRGGMGRGGHGGQGFSGSRGGRGR